MYMYVPISFEIDNKLIFAIILFNVFSCCLKKDMLTIRFCKKAKEIWHFLTFYPMSKY